MGCSPQRQHLQVREAQEVEGISHDPTIRREIRVTCQQIQHG
jgi:hypothetical protein